MLTQLTTVKARLAIAPADTTQDDLLTRAIQAMSARFDAECNRKLARTVGAVQEFAGEATEILARWYPIEAVSKFELKSSEADGWIEQTGVEYVVREGCVVSLAAPLTAVSSGPQVGRVTYTGGYVLPGTVPGAGETALPSDLEWAAVEQVAVWHQQRDKLGLIRHWPSSGTYLVLSQLPLLPAVSAILKVHKRWTI